MSEYALLDRYKNWISSNEVVMNTYANHLIVIFVFTMPLLVSVRRISISLIILLFLARGHIIHHVMNLLRDPLMRAFILYFLVHVLWLVGSDDLMSAKKSLHDSSFLLFAPLFASFIDEKYVRRIAGAYVLGMLVSVMLSYGIFFEIIQAMPHDVTQGVAGDPTPLYHHTPYGYMLAITAVILLYKFLDLQGQVVDKSLVGFLFILIALDMLIIEGRSGFVLFVILTFFMIMLHFRSRAAKPVILTLAIIIVTSILSYSYIDVFKERVDLTIKSSESVVSEKNYNTSIGGRVGMLVYSMEAISENIVFGHGTGDHVAEIIEVMNKMGVKSSSLVKSLTHTHNEYISALVQFGIFGLLAFLNIPYQMLRYSAGFNGVVLKITGISILLYSLIDVFIIGLGMILSVVIISSVCMKVYHVTGARYQTLDFKQLAGYAFAITGLYLIKLVMP